MSIPKGSAIAIVGKDIDPKGFGRVKTMSPLYGPNVTWDQLPYNASISDIHNPGMNKNPPRPGTIILAHLEGGNPAFLKPMGIIDNNGTGSNASNSLQNELKEAREYKRPHVSGPSKAKQTTESNGRGSNIPKTYMDSEAKDDLSTNDFKGIPNGDGSNHQMTPLDIPVKNVATALLPSMQVLTGEMNSLLSALGTPFNIGNIFEILGDKLKTEIFKGMPEEVAIALESIVNTSGSYTATTNGSGFSFDQNQINPAVFLNKATSLLKNTSTVDELRSNLSKLLNDDSFKGMSQVSDITLKSGNAFGDIGITINKNGELSVDISATAQKLEQLFSSLIGSIPILGGESTFMKDSKIPNELLQRMPQEAQSKFKELFEKLKNERPEVEDKLTTLKNKLG